MVLFDGRVPFVGLDDDRKTAEEVADAVTAAGVVWKYPLVLSGGGGRISYSEMALRGQSSCLETSSRSLPCSLKGVSQTTSPTKAVYAMLSSQAFRDMSSQEQFQGFYSSCNSTTLSICSRRPMYGNIFNRLPRRSKCVKGTFRKILLGRAESILSFKIITVSWCSLLSALGSILVM